MQVAEGLHRLTRSVVNFYPVEDGDRLTLIDAGAPGDWDVFTPCRSDPSAGRSHRFGMGAVARGRGHEICEALRNAIDR